MITDSKICSGVDNRKPEGEPPVRVQPVVRQKLWRVNLRSHMERYNPSYVVASDATAAYQAVRADLDKRDYGFAKDRELLSVELVAEDYEYTETGSRLFLPNAKVSDGR